MQYNCNFYTKYTHLHNMYIKTTELSNYILIIRKMYKLKQVSIQIHNYYGKYYEMLETLSLPVRVKMIPDNCRNERESWNISQPINSVTQNFRCPAILYLVIVKALYIWFCFIRLKNKHVVCQVHQSRRVLTDTKVF